MRKFTNLGLNSFSGCKKLTKITAPVRFFKDEYIQEVNRDVPKGLKDTEDEERLYLDGMFKHIDGLKDTEDEERLYP